MNGRWATNNRSGILLVILLTALLCAGFETSAAASHRLTKGELKELIASAATPEDHQKIAAYYRGEAQRLRQSAKEHQDWGDIYARGSAGSESKHPG